MNSLETSIIDLIGESSDSPDVYDSAGIDEIRSHVNDAIEEVCLITGCFKRVWQIPLKANCRFYRIPEARERFGWFYSVYLFGNKSVLSQTDFNGLDWVDTRWLQATGTPTYYAPIGYREIAIYPAPSSSADTLEINGIAIPKRYSEDSDKIALRASWKWAVVNRVVSEWWATRGDAQSAARYFQTYANEIGIPQMYPEQSERRWAYRTKGA